MNVNTITLLILNRILCVFTSCWLAIMEILIINVVRRAQSEKSEMPLILLHSLLTVWRGVPAIL